MNGTALRKRTLWALGAALAILWLGAFPLLLLRWDGPGLLDWTLRYSYSGFTQTKRDTAWLLGGVTALCSLPLLLCGAAKAKGLLSPGRLLLVACFGWMALSMCFGSAREIAGNSGGLAVWEGGNRYEGMSTQLCYLCIFLVCSLLSVHEGMAGLGAALGLTGFAVIVALQYLGGDPLDLYPGTRSILTNYEFQGTIGNIDMCAGYLALVTPLLLGITAVRGGKVGWALLPFGLVGVLLVLMMEVTAGELALGFGLMLLLLLMLSRPETRSRGCVILAGVALCVLLRSVTGLPWLDGLNEPWNCVPRTDAPELPSLTGTEQLIFPWQVTSKKLLLVPVILLLLAAAWGLRKHPGRRVPLKPVLLTLGGLGLAAVLVLWLAPIPANAGILGQIHEVLCGRGSDSMGSERLGVWRHTLHIARDNLLFGTGPDTFLTVMQRHLAAEGATLNQTFDNPHNLLLAILVQNGLPAMLLYIAGIAAIAYRCLKKRTGLPYLAAALCYLVQGMFTFSIVIVTPMFWAVLGLAAGSGDALSVAAATAPPKGEPGELPQSLRDSSLEEGA